MFQLLFRQVGHKNPVVAVHLLVCPYETSGFILDKYVSVNSANVDFIISVFDFLTYLFGIDMGQYEAVGVNDNIVSRYAKFEVLDKVYEFFGLYCYSRQGNYFTAFI